MLSKPTQTEEDFEFAPIENTGKVVVTNLTYGRENAAEHTYTVTIKGGQAIHCTCPAHKYNAGSKHREAVENNADVLAAADPDPLAPIEREDGCNVCEGTGMHGKVACFACVDIPGEEED